MRTVDCKAKLSWVAATGAAALLSGCLSSFGGSPGSSGGGSGANGSNGTGGGSSSSSSSGGGGNNGNQSGVTYYRDVLPVLQKSCMPCHEKGGSGTPALDDAQSAIAAASAIQTAVQAGTMPPFPPAEGCNTYLDELRLSSTDKSTLLSWITGGAEAGDPQTAPAPPAPQPPELGTPDRQLAPPSSFTPTYPGSAGPDDLYWCFPLDPGVSVATDLIAASVTPGQSSEVHHVIVSRDNGGTGTAGKPATGFECNGVPGDMLYAWVPGSRPMKLPSGVGMTLQPSDRLYMQVHYHRSLSIAPSPDSTTTNLYFAQTSEAEHAYVVWTGNPTFSIPANTNNYQVNGTCTVNGDWKLLGIAPHMHKLGTQTQLNAVAGGSQTCLMNIPKWDFNWQGGYGLAQPLQLHAGDTISTSCTYNNNTPNKVAFGESTGDEMCFGFITVVAAQKPTFNGLVNVFSGITGLCAQ
jgi:hypothetical protein